MNDLSDEKIVQLYLETRESIYFQLLYERYYTKVKRRCVSFIRDFDSSADMTQDIFLKLEKILVKFRGQSSFRSWLYSVTSNYCIDQTKIKKTQQARFVPLDEEDINQFEAEENLPSSEDDLKRMRNALKKLNREEQLILVQKYMRNHSVREIAHLNQLTEPAVKMRLKRSRDKLRKEYFFSLG